MVEIMSYNITLFWRLYNLNVDKFLRKQVFISLSYASRAASLRPELVQPEKQPALALGIGISTLRSVGQGKWGLTPYPGAIYWPGHEHYVQSMLPESVAVCQLVVHLFVA